MKTFLKDRKLGIINIFVLLICAIFLLCNHKKNGSEKVNASKAGIQTMYYGVIDEKYPFIMNLTKRGDSVTGNYRYLRKNASIKLNGTLDLSGLLQLTEHIESGVSTGMFTGTIADHSITGEWSSPDSSNRMSFKAYETSQELLAKQQNEIRGLLSKIAGNYSVSSIEGSAFANTMFDGTIDENGWSISGSAISQGMRETIDIEFSESEFDLLDSLSIKVDSESVVKILYGSKVLLSIPFSENELSYESAAISLSKKPADNLSKNLVNGSVKSFCSLNFFDQDEEDVSYLPSDGEFSLSFSGSDTSFMLTGGVTFRNSTFILKKDVTEKK